MNREVHVRFWEGVGVKLPCATQLLDSTLCYCLGCQFKPEASVSLNGVTRVCHGKTVVLLAGHLQGRGHEVLSDVVLTGGWYRLSSRRRETIPLPFTFVHDPSNWLWKPSRARCFLTAKGLARYTREPCP